MGTEKQSLQDLLNVSFTWYDYSFFTVMLAASALIGVYFGFYKKQVTAKDYLFGGKGMSIIPVALSLIANNVSGISLLAAPSDIYRFGVAYWFAYPCLILVTLLSYYVFVPVFDKLQITSTFEYLKLRFDTKTRLLGSVLYGISTLLYLPIVVYVPALALSQATGVHVHLISCLVCVVCIFYTTIGGMKAVVYSDTLQCVIMIGSLVAVVVLGLISVGGVKNVWTTSYEHERLFVHLDLDFTKRDTIWSATIGMFVMWASFMGISQVFIQKCMSLPSRADVKTALVIFTIGLFSIGSMCIITGLIMFTKYSRCDPLTSGQIQEPDQLLPYYIMDVAKSIPGLAGLYIAGVFSASLSTLSGGMNGLSGTIYEDFIARYMAISITENKKSLILKWIAALIGIVCTAMVLVVEKLGGILPLAYSLSGVTSGTILGVFMAGMLLPFVNEKGAYYGGLVSLVIMTWIVAGAQWHQSQGTIVYPVLPLSVEECPILNGTEILRSVITNSTVPADSSEPFVLFKVSYYWYTTMGLVIFIVVSMVVSLSTKGPKRLVNRDFLSPVIYRFLPKSYGTPPPIYSSIDKSLNIIEQSDEEDNKVY